jgi:CheY-like chemotaxis protein
MEALNVLVVEDQTDGQEILASLLTHYGMTVDVAGSGEECLDLLATRSYYTVLIEIMLPGIDAGQSHQKEERGIIVVWDKESNHDEQRNQHEFSRMFRRNT